MRRAFRAYNAYHVAGSRRVYECTPDDTGLFPSHDVVSWATVRRRIQERRRARRSVSPTWSWGRDVTATTLATKKMTPLVSTRSSKQLATLARARPDLPAGGAPHSVAKT